MKFLLLISAFFTLSCCFSQEKFQLIKENTSSIEFIFTHKTSSFSYTNLEGKNYINFSSTEKVTLLEKGNPCLPAESITLAIPSKGVSSVEIIEMVEEIIPNTEVLPSKGNLMRNVDPSTVPYTFSETYQKNEFFPANAFRLYEPFNLRSIRGQVLHIYPYRYNPVTKQLSHIKSIKIKVHFDPSAKGLNELSSTKNKVDEQHFASLFFNGKQTEKYNAVADNGDLLILCPQSYKDSIQALIDWKIQKGFHTKVIDIASSGETAVSVKAKVQSEYEANPAIKYLLIIGDHQQVPTYSYGMSSEGENLYSDSYFGQLTGTDYYPEVFVGRLSGTTTQVASMIRKTLSYEINPADGDWMTKAVGLASGQGAGIGDDDEADWQHMRGIRTQLLDYGYSEVYEFYEGTRGQEDASGNPTSAIILPAVSGGVGLFNYTGHGDINTCITGNFGSTQVNQATNYNMFPFVISVACNNGTFTSTTCISEAWLRATKNGQNTGAIGACGSSILMAWAPPMETQDEMTKLITKTGTTASTTLGGLFYNSQLSMLQAYPTQGVEVMQTWVLFGDPTVDFRSRTTSNLNADVPTCLPANSSSVTISSLIDSIWVAASQNGNVLAKTFATSSSVSMDISAANTVDPIVITCSKPNSKPYIDTLFKGCSSESPGNSMTINPTFASESFTIKSADGSKQLSYKIVDIRGRIVREEQQILMDSKEYTVDVRSFANGMYQVYLNQGSEEQVIKIVVSH